MVLVLDAPRTSIEDEDEDEDENDTPPLASLASWRFALSTKLG